MTEVLGRRPKATLALGAVLLAACFTFLVGATSQARADTPQAYCPGVHLGAWGRCEGASRWLDRVYGWGDEHGVCVYFSLFEGGGPLQGSNTCTPYQDTGVYSPYDQVNEEPGFAVLYPHVNNNSQYKNTVHGIAFTP
jgi:hypothetical protein